MQSPPLIPLESLQIASPCQADWNAMQKLQGSDCVRFCPSCGKNVYSVSGMTREQALKLIAEKDGNVCLRLHRRSDGTVITSDCPVGKTARIKRGQAGQLFAAAMGFGTAILGLCGVWLHRSTRVVDSAGIKVTKRPLLAKRVTGAPPLNEPKATAVPTLSAPVEERNRSEGVFVTNGPSELPHPPATDDNNDTSGWVTMGAPIMPPPTPTPQSSPNRQDALTPEKPELML